MNGNRLVWMENDTIRAGILADKGADLVSIVWKQGDVELLAKTANHQRTLETVNFSRIVAKAYNEYYIGGWQSLVPSSAERNGNVLGGGESATRPWNYELRAAGDGICAVFKTELPLSGLKAEKKIVLQPSVSNLHVEETVTNSQENDILFSWTQHPAFSGNLLDHETRFELPASAVYDYLGHQNGAGEMCAHEYSAAMVKHKGEVIDLTRYADVANKELFYTVKGLAEGALRIDNRSRRLKVSLDWDLQTFPHMWFWASDTENIRTVAFEPSSTYAPDFESSKRYGLLHRLGPGESRRTWIKLSVAGY